MDLSEFFFVNGKTTHMNGRKNVLIFFPNSKLKNHKKALTQEIPLEFN